MFYAMDNCRIHAVDFDAIMLGDGHHYFGIITLDESEAILQKLGLNSRLAAESAANKSMTFENHEGFDFINLHIPNYKASAAHGENVCIYVLKNVIVFICKKVSAIENMIYDKAGEEYICVGFDRLLSTFFERITSKDFISLEKIELEISGLENALISSGKRNCVKEIISLRKRLMVFKQYYEQMLNVLDELQENENELLQENSLRYFRIYAGKVERLYHNVINLRDYVTQVREAYQAEVDIALNNIMKIFTVITAIFLPLTLLVGWYGMNIKMPEFEWAYSYPMVIVLSIAVVLLCLFYFKKKKWF